MQDYMKTIISINKMLLFISIFLFSGCSKSYSLNIELNDNATIECENKEKKYIDINNITYKNFISWFESNNNGWRKSPVSYVPRVILSNDNYKFIFLDKLVVVNFDSSQYVKEINSNSFYKDFCEN